MLQLGKGRRMDPVRMVKRWILLWAGLLGLAAVGATAQVGGGSDLTWSTTDGGGATFSTGGGYKLGGTIGQPDAGEQNGGGFTLRSGFWGGICAPVLAGHLTYQGMGQPHPGNVQSITVKLQPPGGGLVSTYTTDTDQQGNFSVAVGSLPSGTYNWWLKAPPYLAGGGTLTLPGACIVSYEFGTQRAGDINNDNCV